MGEGDGTLWYGSSKLYLVLYCAVVLAATQLAMEQLLQPPAANLLETGEEDNPEQEVYRVVQHHADNLGYKCSQIFHGYQQVSYPIGVL